MFLYCRRYTLSQKIWGLRIFYNILTLLNANIKYSGHILAVVCQSLSFCRRDTSAVVFEDWKHLFALETLLSHSVQNKAKGRLKVATAELFKDRKAFNIGQKNCQQQPRTETRFNILTHERRQDNESLFSSFIIVSLMPQYCRLAGKSWAIIFFSKTLKCPKRTQSYYLSTRASEKVKTVCKETASFEQVYKLEQFSYFPGWP